MPTPMAVPLTEPEARDAFPHLFTSPDRAERAVQALRRRQESTDRSLALGIAQSCSEKAGALAMASSSNDVRRAEPSREEPPVAALAGMDATSSDASGSRHGEGPVVELAERPARRPRLI